MPLSEHEQRLLDQIERALYAEDPKFATSVRSSDLRSHARRRIRRASVLFALGFVLLPVGVITNNVPVGIVGFIVMLGALMLGLTAWKRSNGSSSPTLRSVDGRTERTTRTKKASSGGSAKDRLEQRWKRRWEERGGPE